MADGLPIPLDWITQGGATALLGLVVWLVLSGRLVPRSTYHQLERDRDHWREVAQKAVEHNGQLMPAAQNAASAISELAAAARGDTRPDRTSREAWKALGGGGQ
jgi:hypothetical protein